MEIHFTQSMVWVWFIDIFSIHRNRSFCFVHFIILSDTNASTHIREPEHLSASIRPSNGFLFSCLNEERTQRIAKLFGIQCDKNWNYEGIISRVWRQWATYCNRCIVDAMSYYLSFHLNSNECWANIWCAFTSDDRHENAHLRCATNRRLFSLSLSFSISPHSHTQTCYSKGAMLFRVSKQFNFLFIFGSDARKIVEMKIEQNLLTINENV